MNRYLLTLGIPRDRPVYELPTHLATLERCMRLAPDAPKGGRFVLTSCELKDGQVVLTGEIIDGEG